MKPSTPRRGTSSAQDYFTPLGFVFFAHDAASSSSYRQRSEAMRPGISRLGSTIVGRRGCEAVAMLLSFFEDIYIFLQLAICAYAFA